MTEEEKKKTLKELYRSFLNDIDKLDEERLSFMRRVVGRIEKERTEKALSALRA